MGIIYMMQTINYMIELGMQSKLEDISRNCIRVELNGITYYKWL